MLNLLIRLAALLGSYFGWWEYFRRRWKVNVYFLPAFTLAVHFTLLFLPGLFNFLEEMSLALYFGGVLLALDALRREKLSLFKPYLNPGYAVALVLFALVAVSVRGQVFTWFDNFTHWATVVRNMLEFDRFPTFAQTAVGFPSYPLGSSTLVYYICNVTSDEESMQMLAQGFVTISMLLPVFAYVKKLPLLCAAVTAVTGNLLLYYNIPPQELLVDTLLPLTAVAAIAFAHQEYEREEKRSHWFCFPLLFLTLNTKNSAFFFLAAAFALLLYWQKQAGRPMKELLWLLLALAAGYFLWDRHCDYVFLNSDLTQHAISTEYLKGRLSEKTPEVIAAIVSGVCRFTFTRQELPWMLGAIALTGVLTWVLAPQLRKPYIKLTVFLVCVYLLYMTSLAGMYVFSMSAEGALGLECIERYTRTIDIAFLACLLMFSFCMVGQIPGRGAAAAACLVLLAGTLGMRLGYTFPEPETPSSDGQIRWEISDLLAEYGVAPSHAYLVLGQSEDEDALYRHYVYRYCLNSPNVTSLTVTDIAQLEEQPHHPYIIIEDTDNPIILSWLREHCPDWNGEQVIQDF